MIRQKVRELAEARGINQGQLSRLSNVGYTTIRRIFDDPAYAPNFATLERIAKALDVSAMDLIEEVPDTDEKQ